jgi:hypothetical protein
MKVRNIRIVLLAIACVGMTAGTLLSVRKSSKPSLSAAMQAQSVGQLLDVIQSESILDDPAARLGDFFVVVDEVKRKTSFPKAAKVILDKAMVLRPGDLKQDPAQIQKIKAYYAKKNLLNRKFRGKSISQCVDDYAQLLLCFTAPDGKTKIYINNPWPNASNNAIYNIIQKWDKNK